MEIQPAIHYAVASSELQREHKQNKLKLVSTLDPIDSKRQKFSSRKFKFFPSSEIFLTKKIENKVYWLKNDSHASRRFKKIISGSSDNDIKIWDLNENQNKSKSTLIGHEDLVWCFLIDPHQRSLISGSWDNTIKIWDLRNGELIRTLEGHTSIVWCLAWCLGEHLASGSFDNTIKVSV